MRLLEYPVIALILIIFFSACSAKKDNNVAVYKLLDEGLVSSKIAIVSHTDLMFQQLQSKLEDPKTRDKAIVIKPQADQVKDLSKEMSKYINNLKNELFLKASIINKNGSDSLQLDNTNAVEEIFQTKNKGQELYDKLVKYEQHLIEINPDMANEFDTKLKVELNIYDSTVNNSAAFIHLFSNTNVIAAIAALDKIDNSVSLAVDEMVTYCNYKVNYNFDGYERFRALVAQSTNYVKVGEEIGITAGIGAFSTSSIPKVFIDGKNISLNPDGVAIYKIKAPDKFGKHVAHVKIIYTTPDGNKDTYFQDVEYDVIKDPCATN